MRCYELTELDGPQSLHLVERPEESPGPRQVKIRVHAASLNYRDLMIANGRYNPRQWLPLVPLSDAAGEILAVGAEVERWHPGDRVATCFFANWDAGPLTRTAQKSARGGGIDGVLSQEIVVDADGLVAVPPSLSWEEAATLPCAAVTAWHAVIEVAAVQPGQTVLLLGTGGVSLFALQFAKLAGARTIITSSSDSKLQRAQQMGADHGINYREQSAWDEEVLKLTQGQGVDVVVEVGGPGTLPRSMNCCKAGGTIALIGVLSEPAGQVNPLPLLMNAIRLQGIFVGHRVMFERMIRAIAVHELHPMVDRVFAFDEAPEAYRWMADGSHFGKLVIAVS